MRVLRQVSARAFTFSTMFCSFACCAEPVSSQAPPSIITSFCRSWTTSTQRAGSRVSASSFIRYLLAHVWLVPRANLGGNRVQRRRARDVERMPVLAAPGEVAGVLGDADHAEMLAGGRDHPDPTRPGHP